MALNLGHRDYNFDCMLCPICQQLYAACISDFLVIVCDLFITQFLYIRSQLPFSYQNILLVEKCLKESKSRLISTNSFSQYFAGVLCRLQIILIELWEALAENL